MPSYSFRPPDHIIEKWPEVFEDLQMNTLPLYYMNHFLIKFDNGSEWQIDIKMHLTKNDPASLVDMIFQILEEYRDEIVNVDFDIDAELLKSDIKNKTKGLLG